MGEVTQLGKFRNESGGEEGVQAVAGLEKKGVGLVCEVGAERGV